MQYNFLSFSVCLSLSEFLTGSDLLFKLHWFSLKARMRKERKGGKEEGDKPQSIVELIVFCKNGGGNIKEAGHKGVRHKKNRREEVYREERK